jgi:predicted RNase H-related nuclease YkuK (DUF458 family)
VESFTTTDGDTDQWFDPGSGSRVSIDYIVDRIRSNKNYTVHIGTDSHKTKGDFRTHTFATVICLYEQGKGADYYFRRSIRDGKYTGLRQRIMDEVTFSVDTAVMLLDHIPNSRIVVHADVNSDPQHATFNFLGQIRSWVSSVGFKFECKPDAWASSGVADKHAK